MKRNRILINNWSNSQAVKHGQEVLRLEIKKKNSNTLKQDIIFKKHKVAKIHMSTYFN